MGPSLKIAYISLQFQFFTSKLGGEHNHTRPRAAPPHLLPAASDREEKPAWQRFRTRNDRCAVRMPLMNPPTPLARSIRCHQHHAAIRPRSLNLWIPWQRCDKVTCFSKCCAMRVRNLSHPLRRLHRSSCPFVPSAYLISWTLFVGDLFREKLRRQVSLFRNSKLQGLEGSYVFPANRLQNSQPSLHPRNDGSQFFRKLVGCLR